MFKINGRNIRKFNLIGTFVILIVFAFSVVLLSTNSNIEEFTYVENDIKNKFLEDKKNDIKFKINNLNILIKNLEKINPQNIEKRKELVLKFVEQSNEQRDNPITIEPLEKDFEYYEELISKNEIFIYDKIFDQAKNKDVSTIKYLFLNKDFNWVISTTFEDNIMHKEIMVWKEHLNTLILDNIYVHISLLFFFSIALLLMVYVINKFSSETLTKCQKNNLKREDSLKQNIHVLEQKIESEKEKFDQQSKMIQKECKMLALAEMLGNLSHQWKEPLTDISNTALSIKSKIETHMIATDEDIEKLTHINNSSEYLTRTIEDFRVFLKADSLKIDFVVNEIIEKAISIDQAIIEKNNIKVITELDDDITIHNLSFGLLQAMVNIIYNAKDALKKIPEDDRYIFITSKNHEDSIEITITDTGKGIPEDVIGNIFKPYFTTKQKTYGTGLGLHMAYNIIEQNMSGKISVSNKNVTYKSGSYTGASFSIILYCNENKED